MTISGVIKSAVVICFAWAVTAAAEDATKVDPEHYKVEFENDKVRVIRIKYDGKEESPMHSHASGVIINLTSGKARMTLPDGTAEDSDAEMGMAYWADASEHSVVNLEDGLIEAILIELK